MLRKIGQLATLIGLSALLMLGIVLIASSYPGVGSASTAGTGGLPLTAGDNSSIPPVVVEDATEMAKTLFGDSQEEVNNFVNQVLAIYTEAKDKDFIILFNSGGWGWNLLEDSQGWESIFTGIKTKLNVMGYQALALDYQRTRVSWRACLEEASEIANFYPSKARDLAGRVELLTRHIPEVKVILAGESTGTVIAEKVMTILKDNPRVYTIQTGPPFWHKRVKIGNSEYAIVETDAQTGGIYGHRDLVGLGCALPGRRCDLQPGAILADRPVNSPRTDVPYCKSPRLTTGVAQ